VFDVMKSSSRRCLHCLLWPLTRLGPGSHASALPAGHSRGSRAAPWSWSLAFVCFPPNPSCRGRRCGPGRARDTHAVVCRRVPHRRRFSALASTHPLAHFPRLRLLLGPLVIGTRSEWQACRVVDVALLRLPCPRIQRLFILQACHWIACAGVSCRWHGGLALHGCGKAGCGPWSSLFSHGWPRLAASWLPRCAGSACSPPLLSR